MTANNRTSKRLVKAYVNKVYVPNPATDQDKAYGIGSIFLAGPTPRDEVTPSWRPDFVRRLARAKAHCTVYIPEQKNGKWLGDYERQCEWEYDHLNLASVVAFWVPRELKTMPAFTTNVEFGYWLGSKKMFYGRPDDADKIRYLDWMYDKEYGEQPSTSMKELVERVINYLKE